MQNTNSDAIALQRIQAKKFFLARDYANAEKILKALVKTNEHIQDTDFLEINKLLGNIYFRTRNYEAALKTWQSLENRFPENIEILVNLSIAYKFLKMYDKSIAVLEQAKSIEGETETILFNLGSTYKDAQDFKNAIECFQQLVKLKPDDALAYNYLGTAYLSSGDEDNAAYYYKKGLLVDQNHPYLNYNLANIYKKNKAYTEALAFYNVALKVNPNWTEVLKEISDIYTIEGKILEAIAIQKSIIKTSGEDESILLSLAHLHLSINAENEAEEYYKRALAVNKSEMSALEYSKYLISKNKNNEALMVLRDAKNNGATNFELLVYLANTALKMQDFSGAKETIQILYKQNPRSIEVLKIYGKLFSLIGDHSNAEKIFLQILSQVPQEIGLRLELAKQQIKLKEYENAKSQLVKYISEVPRDYEARILLAECYRNIGELKKAEQEYHAILKDDPKNLDAILALSEFLQDNDNVLEVVNLADKMINLISERDSIADFSQLKKSLEIYEKACEKFNSQKAIKPKFLKTSTTKKMETDSSELKAIQEEEESFELNEEKANNDLNMPFDDLVELSDDEESWKVDEPINETTLKDIVDVDSPMDMLSEDESFPGSDIQSQRDAAFLSPMNQGFLGAEPENLNNAKNKNTDYVLPDVEDEKGFSGPPSSPYTNEYNVEPEIPENFSSPEKQMGNDDFVLPNASNDNSGDMSIDNPISDKSLLDSLNEKLNALNLPEYSDTVNDVIKNQNDLLKKQADMIKSLDEQLQDFDELLQIGKNPKKEELALAKQNELLDTLNDKLSKLELPEYKDESFEHAKNAQDELINQQKELLENLEEKIDSFDELLHLGMPETTETNDEELDENTIESIDENIPKTIEESVAETFSDNISDNNISDNNISDNIDKTITENSKPINTKKVPVGKIKPEEQFNDALKSISPAEMLQLFKCLRDLMLTLPEEESKKFLLSDQRLQMQYIIEKLTGTVGLRVRAIFMKMRDFLKNNDNYDASDVTVKTLLHHLKDLASNLPDKGFAKICIQKLDNVIKKMT